MFIIRCRDTTGTKRFTLDSLDITVGQLLDIIIGKGNGGGNGNDKTSTSTTALDHQLSLSPSPTDPPLLLNGMLNKLSLQNGHLFYLHSSNSKVMEIKKNTIIPPSLQECYDAIREGKGTRKSPKQQQLGPNCLRLHGAKGMCPSCKPKEVWEIAREMSAKHSSIHTYYQEQLVKIGKTFTLPSESSTTTNTGISCKHPPQNRCTNCTESKMTNLQRQPYRIIDHVEFLDPSLVDSFLRDGWRRDGLQHMAWIYGHYQLMDHKDDPPLGIKATAVFLHHPSKQKNFTDGFCVLDCCDGSGCNSIGYDGSDCSSSTTTTTEDVLLEMFGLEKIGLLYTDLKQEHVSGSGGKVAQGRQTLSGSEFCFIANEQLKHKAPLPWSKEKTCFGSPFVTVVVSGDKDGQIGLEAYQCSTQCTSLVERQLVKPCFELDMMSVQPSKGHEIVYGGSCGVGNVRADPFFPVDYFLVSLTTAFKDVSSGVGDDDEMAIIENDDMSSVKKASLAPQIRTDLKSFLCPLPQEQERRMALLKNMNLFIHLIPTLPKHDLHLLSLLIRKDDRSILCSQWWKGVVEEVEAAAVEAATASTSVFSTENQENSSAGSPSVCSHCTFLNEGGGDADGMCEMCGLPLH